MLVGLFNGVMIVVFGLPSLVVTIGTLALYRGLAQIILRRGVLIAFRTGTSRLGSA
jgi:rhamnose transport system permease protein